MRYSIDDAFNYEEEFETEIQFLMKSIILSVRIFVSWPTTRVVKMSFILKENLPDILMNIFILKIWALICI